MAESVTQKHHRRSVRLKGYNYAETGAYFVTVCTQNWECLFGGVVDGGMRLNRYGEIVRRCWADIPCHFPGVETDAFVVMPNHVHGILVIVGGARATHASPLRKTEQRAIAAFLRREVVEEIRAFLKPVLTGDVLGKVWLSGKGWRRKD